MEAKAVHLLAAINRLNLKCFSAASKKTLIFLILNDTIQISNYQRAVLWKINDRMPPTLLGVSGQFKINQNSPLAKRWSNTIQQKIKGPDRPQVFEFTEKVVGPPGSEPKEQIFSILWLPIFVQGKLKLGLWLERWESQWFADEIIVLNFLMQGYGAAWEKFPERFTFTQLLKKRNLIIGAGLSLLILALPVPLRVTAPCEVVPKDPIVVTAPLEGIIEKIVVAPGQEVEKDNPLFEYDKQVPMEEYKVAKKQVQILRADIERATIQSYKDPKELSELSVLNLKKQKEELQLELAQYKLSKLTVKSPDNGIVVMQDDPDEWRGGPVKLGEKVMTIADPNKTKVRIWVPEADNIDIDLKKPIKIFLDVAPEKDLIAYISYISSYSTLNEKSISSFIADAEWEKQPKDIKMGLKGTAVLYGENVSLFYWIIRKPWSHLRYLIGL